MFQVFRCFSAVRSKPRGVFAGKIPPKVTLCLFVSLSPEKMLIEIHRRRTSRPVLHLPDGGGSDSCSLFDPSHRQPTSQRCPCASLTHRWVHPSDPAWMLTLCQPLPVSESYQIRFLSGYWCFLYKVCYQKQADAMRCCFLMIYYNKVLNTAV